MATAVSTKAGTMPAGEPVIATPANAAAPARFARINHARRRDPNNGRKSEINP